MLLKKLKFLLKLNVTLALNKELPLNILEYLINYFRLILNSLILDLTIVKRYYNPNNL